MAKNIIGIIGGSGLYKMEGVEITEERTVKTPYGETSDKILLGRLGARDIAFLPRHGRGHSILPHEINFRANIYALKVLGVKKIVSVSAVGSMREEIQPGDLVMVDQFIDRTKDRPQTFFGVGIAAHVAFADPVCENLREACVGAAKEAGVKAHSGGTYVCIEGPMFSTRAESNLYRSWGVSVIGMTNYQEAKLAREAEICYSTIALVTDYDCWRTEESDVDVEMIIKTLTGNVEKAQKVIKHLLPKLSDADCACQHALENAIMTNHEIIPEKVKTDLKPIIGRYIK